MSPESSRQKATGAGPILAMIEIVDLGQVISPLEPVPVNSDLEYIVFKVLILSSVLILSMK